MDQDIKNEWVERLRSGVRQGFGKLKDGDCYCIMGVLCEVSVDLGIGEWTGSGEVYKYDKQCSAYGFPMKIATKFGMDNSNGGGPNVKYNGRLLDLMTLNDIKKLSFDELATIIEEQL